jgi:AraC-like DNA-binding protein
VLSLAWRREGPHRAAAHSHPRAHIIQPLEGAYWVLTPAGKWLVPTGQAIWIPPLTHHEIYSHGTVAARMIFVDSTFADSLPRQAGTVRVSPLLGRLLERALGYGNDYPHGGPETRLALVMLDELAAMEVAPLLVPISTEPRLARAMMRQIEAPGSQIEIEDLAEGSGASARTLARLFRSETGMTFPQWRTRLRLVESIERLARGLPVSEVAFDLGYGTVSSFVYMFRSNMGETPGSYRARVVPGA